MEPWTLRPIARYTADCCQAHYDKYDEEIKSAIREVGVRNMLIEQRLHHVLRQFQKRNINVIVMKGCHLIHSLYPFGIRPIEDIDISLDRDYYTVVDQIMGEMGYDHCAADLDLWTHVHVSNKLTYMNRTDPKIPIDFHFSLGSYPYLGRMPFHDLLEHAEPVADDLPAFWVLKSEMLLVHLCLHLFQHHHEKWQVSAYDICTLTTLRDESMDWKVFLSIVEKYALQLPVQYAISKASSLADIPIPAAVTTKLHTMKADRKQRRIFQSSLTMVHGMEKYSVQFWALPGIRLKLQCLRRIVFPSASFLRDHYNGNYFKYVMSVGTTAAKGLYSAWK